MKVPGPTRVSVEPSLAMQVAALQWVTVTGGSGRGTTTTGTAGVGTRGIATAGRGGGVGTTQLRCDGDGEVVSPPRQASATRLRSGSSRAATAC